MKTKPISSTKLGRVELYQRSQYNHQFGDSSFRMALSICLYYITTLWSFWSTLSIWTDKVMWPAIRFLVNRKGGRLPVFRLKWEDHQIQSRCCNWAVESLHFPTYEAPLTMVLHYIRSTSYGPQLHESVGMWLLQPGRLTTLDTQHRE